jgi:hypothetical protein
MTTMTDVKSSFSSRMLLRLAVPGLVVLANVRLDAIDPLTSP